MDQWGYVFKIRDIQKSAQDVVLKRPFWHCLAKGNLGDPTHLCSCTTLPFSSAASKDAGNHRKPLPAAWRDRWDSQPNEVHVSQHGTQNQPPHCPSFIILQYFYINISNICLYRFFTCDLIHGVYFLQAFPNSKIGLIRPHGLSGHSERSSHLVRQPLEQSCPRPDRDSPLQPPPVLGLK